MPALINPETGELAFADDPTGAIQQGWRVATPAEADEAAKRTDLGTAGQTAQALGERVVRGATLGAVRGFGSPEDIQGRADVSESEHPILSGAADLVPQVAIGALGAATGGAAAVGLGAAEGGLAAAAGGLAGESLGTAAVGTAQQAFGRGQYLGEDPGRDAENALLWGGLTFGLGAAQRALFGGAAEVVGKGAAELEQDTAGETAKASIDDVMQAAESKAANASPAPEVAPELSGDTLQGIAPPVAPEPAPLGADAAAGRVAAREAVDDGMDRAVANASRSDADDVLQQALGDSAPDPEANSFGRQRRLYQNRDAIMEVSVKEMQSDLTDVVGEVGDLTRQGKLGDILGAVGENGGSQRVVTDGIAQSAAELAGTLKGEGRAYASDIGEKGIRYAAPGTKDLVSALEQHARDIAAAKDGRSMFDAANAFKQMLDDTKISLESGAARSDNPKAIQDLIPRVASMASGVRSALEDASVWGKAGDMQKAYNAVIHDQLLPSMKVFEESVLKRTSKGYDALWNTEGWEPKIATLLKGDNQGAARHVNGVLDAMDQLGALRAQYGDTAGGASITGKVAKIRRTMGLASEVNDAATRMQAAGALARGVPLVGGALKEWVTGDLANNFRRLAGATDSAINRGVDAWIESSVTRGASGALLGAIGKVASKAVGAADGAVAQLAARQGISHELARFMGDDATPTAAFERARQALTNDETFFQSLGGDYKSLQSQAPETFMMLAARASTLRAFLIDKMPPNVSVSMLNPAGYPPAREAIEDWAQYWNAAKAPTRVVENLRSASAEQLNTIQVNFPRLYELTQQRTLEKLGQATAAGRQLDDRLLMRLGILFPLDGVGSPAFSARVGQMIRDYASQQQGSGSGGAAPPPSPQGMSTPLQSVQSNGATFGSGF